MTTSVRIELLGSPRVLVNGVAVEAGRRQHALLAVLALRAGRSCSDEELFDAVWPEDLPGTGLKVLAPNIYRIRRLLGDAGLIERTSNGYALRIPPVVVDLVEFESLARTGEQKRADGDAAAARHAYTEALTLIRGEPLAGLPGTALAAQRRRLAERLDRIASDRIDLDLELGLAAELVPELTAAVDERPLDERLAGQLMSALAAIGRRADALDVYLRTRTTLVDELGVEPGRDLQAIQQRILREESTAGILDQLPYAGLPLVGRGAELTLLAAALQRPDPAAPLVVTVDGMPGVGKTALAVEVARRVAARYPDGILFLDLHGHAKDHRPLDADAAVNQLLTSAGVAPERLVASLDQRTALWRSEVAGKRLLIVLDNVADTRSVAPLLPGSATCAVLITSRRQLTGLAVTERIALDPLDPAEAIRLLAEVAGDERVAGEPQAAAELVERCGWLPLAIRILGAKLRHRPQWTVEYLGQRLANRASDRLQEFGTDDDGVLSAFELSYRQLAPEQQRMFRLLSRIPGHDLDAYGGAALAGVTPLAAELTLESLVDASLLQEPTAGRYQLHDLLTQYAGAVAAEEPPAGLEQSTERILEYYLQASDHPQSRIAGMAFVDLSGRDPVPLPDLDTTARSKAWGDAEASNLLAATRTAAAGKLDEYCYLLALSSARYLHLRGRIQDRDELLHLGLEASRRVGDQVAEARLLNALARLGKPQHGVHRSIEYLRLGLERLPANGDPALRIQLLAGLGNCLSTIDPLGEAMTTLQESVRLARDLGDQRVLSRSLSMIAMHHAGLLQFGPALEYYDEALAILDRLGDRSTQPDLLSGRAGACIDLGRLDEAVDSAKAAIALAEELGTAYSLPYALGHLGRAYRLLGRSDDAVRTHRQAVEIATSVSSRGAELVGRLHLGHSLIAAGQPDQAIEQFDHVLRTARANSDDFTLARALEGLGAVADSVGDPATATQYWQQAVDLLDSLHPPYAARVRAQLQRVEPS
ncbi:BTAD domain-containing putative transcriptional regulator [Kribbella sp. NPDC056861]|uniref:AfsR/SARP family transcriptional regulator n=1 Tax=Kribbella sp. NPDC056861 TaxID=3154857 RepID=UPI003420C391